MRFKTKFAVLALAAVLGVGLWPSQGYAATGLIYISPSGTSVSKGKEVTVNLRINPGTAVNAVQATVNYNSSDLQYVTSSLGAFSACTVDSGVSFACAKLGGSTSSDSLIASITFKALVGSGSASLSVSGANAASASSSTYTNPSSSGGSISFTSPSSPKPSSGSGARSSGGSSASSTTSTASSTSTSPSTTGGSTTTTKTSKNNAPLHSVSSSHTTITVLSSNIEFNSAAVTISATTPVQTYIKYGTDNGNLAQATPLSNFGKQAIITLDSPSLTPGTTYYYQAIAKDSSGKVVADSSVQSFTTRGYALSVTVLDSNYHPVVGKLVTLHSVPMTAKTNDKGVATFTDVAPGAHHIDYTSGGHTYTQLVYVANNVVDTNGTQSAAKQTAAVVLHGYEQSKADSSLGRTVGILAVVAAIGVIVVAREVVVSRVAEKRVVESFKHTKTPNVT